MRERKHVVVASTACSCATGLHLLEADSSLQEKPIPQFVDFKKCRLLGLLQHVSLVSFLPPLLYCLYGGLKSNDGTQK